MAQLSRDEIERRNEAERAMRLVGRLQAVLDLSKGTNEMPYDRLTRDHIDSMRTYANKAVLAAWEHAHRLTMGAGDG